MKQLWILLLLMIHQSQQRQPNILLLLTDDQDVLLHSFDYMKHTREWLVQGGIQMEAAYVHTPVCCPARSTLLSGRYLHNGAARNNSQSGGCDSMKWRQDIESTSTYAMYAKQYGYTTAFCGKYLNTYGYGPEGVPRVPPGWDHWLGLVGNSRYYNYDLIHSNDTGKTATKISFGSKYETDYLPNVLKNYTLNLLETNLLPSSQPWLLVVSWPTPHGPFTPAPWAESYFVDKQAPRTPNYNISDPTKHWLVRQLPHLNDKMAQEVDEIYRKRLQALLSVDQHVHALHQLLLRHASRPLNNTNVIYTSDHGYQLGQHCLSMDKRHLYEHDIRVPLVVAGPGISKKSSSSALVVNIDLAPTLWDWITQRKRPMPTSFDGMSLLPVLYKKAASLRIDFLVSYHGEGSMPCGLAECPMPQPPQLWDMPDAWNNTYHCVRTLRVRENTMYCQFEDDEAFVEYYDLEVDPWQLQNAASTLTPIQHARYQKRLEELKSCHGEECRHPH